MILMRMFVILVLWAVLPKLISHEKINSLINKIKQAMIKIKFLINRIYRLINLRKSSYYVWKDLVKYHKESGWNFGQYDHEMNIRCLFAINDNRSLNFSYTVEKKSLIFSAIILHSFDEERTNDVMVLASHFNSLLNYGVVRVNLYNNYIEYSCSIDLLLFSLFPTKIKSYSDMHYGMTLDCYWAFNNMITSGDDPVFVFSELLRNKENNNNQDA